MSTELDIRDKEETVKCIRFASPKLSAGLSSYFTLNKQDFCLTFRDKNAFNASEIVLADIDNLILALKKAKELLTSKGVE